MGNNFIPFNEDEIPDPPIPYPGNARVAAPTITDDGKLTADSLGEYTETSERDEDDGLVDLYDKVGGYYGWNWTEFMSVPKSIIMKLNAKIDEKLENCTNSDSIFSFQYLSTLLAISKAFGGKD